MAQVKLHTVFNQKIDGKEVKLQLTTEEVEAALSVCKINAIDSVIILKKYNGSACFYINERNANAAQERHGFDYAFTVQAEDLAEFASKTKKTNNSQN